MAAVEPAHRPSSATEAAAVGKPPSPKAIPGAADGIALATPQRPAALAINAAGSSQDLGSASSANDALLASSPSSPGRRGMRQVQPLRIPEKLQRITKDMLKMSRTVEGTGSFARVVRATLNEPGKEPVEVAVKVMNRFRALSSAFVNLQQELDIVAQLEHPCIINTLACFEDDENIYIVMELAENGELYKYTRDVGLEDMPIVAPNFIAEAVLGLEYMASKGLAHRDIKPENLLLTSGFHVKLADFGTVCRVDSPENTFTGTASYVSPEMLNESRASATSDIWALGCVLFHLFVGRAPFKGDTEHLVLEAVKARHIDWPPSQYFPAVARDLVEKMLQMDPTQRIGAKGFDEIKKHPFFERVDWDNLLSKSNETFLNANFTRMYQMHLTSKERVVYAGMVTKRRYKGLSCTKRILVLTDYPQLFYLDPESTILKKGNVPWDGQLCAQADDANVFHCHTSKSRVYHFVDHAGRAPLWAAKINHLVRTKRD